VTFKSPHLPLFTDTAWQALDHGLFNRIVTGEHLVGEALQPGMKIVRNDTLAVKLTKQANNQSYNAVACDKHCHRGWKPYQN
jgi:enoyl-CoA hydratase/carnithine racemase